MTTAPFVPGPDPAWEVLPPGGGGFAPADVEAVASLARAHETPWPRSFFLPDGRYAPLVEWNESGPWSDVAGPVRERGGPAGLVLRDGRVAAEWGDTDRPDVTFSVAKSYLAVLAGLAVGDGLIPDLDAPVAATIAEPLLDGERHGRITWRHFLHGTSEWGGILHGKSDQVDHRREVGPGADNSRKGERRELEAPGSRYEYNDVRVNLLAHCLARVFGRALPDVLRERIAGPIGMSSTWEWLGYAGATVDTPAGPVPHVPGGSHWGGGLFMSTRDHARFGLLCCRDGMWGDRRILPAGWVSALRTPSPLKPDYGLLWWLNRGPHADPRLPAGSFWAMGAGANVVWIDPDRDLVIVLRWVAGPAVNDVLAAVLAALSS